MKTDTSEIVLYIIIGVLIAIGSLGIFAVWQKNTVERIEMRKACDAINGVTVHLQHSQSLCFVDGKLVKASK